MKFMNKMERKFGKYAIPNLTFYIIGTYVIGYLLQFLAPKVLTYLLLDPYKILHGQVWRLVTWLLMPPWTFNILILITLLCYYSIGSALERCMGTFRYNVYIFGGVLATILAAFALYGFTVLTGDGTSAAITSFIYSYSFNTYFISMSIFLGYAILFPDMRLYFMFLIPVKMKWLAMADVIYLVYSMFKMDWGGRIVVLVSLLNVLVFFLLTRNSRGQSPKEMRRRQIYKSKVTRANQVTKHKCAICGRTELDGDNLEFRFCSRCAGNYEYCQDHIFTHEHKK